MISEKAIHPGDFLSFYIEEMALNQSALAERIGCKPAKINEICNHKRGITAEMAVQLSQALGTSAELWMNVQKNWELSEAFRKLNVSLAASNER